MGGSSNINSVIIPSGGFSEIELENIFHDFLCSVTALPPELVRPFFQETPPPLPSIKTDWAAFSISGFDESGAHISQNTENGETAFKLAEYQTLTVLFSFYGPTSANYARAFRRALRIAQNRSFLRAYNIAFLKFDEIRQVPEQYGGFWVKRFDVQVYFTVGPYGEEGTIDLKLLREGDYIWHS